jgi:hypothetical protein
VGYVRGDGYAWCSLVRPADDWLHWDPEAEQVHGIQRHQLLEHGRSVLEVAQRLNQDLAGQVLYCDGWAHDYAWLARLFESAQLNPLFRLESVVRLLSEQQLARLDDARHDAFAALGITRHRASSDARALQWALERLAA